MAEDEWASLDPEQAAELIAESEALVDALILAEHEQVVETVAATKLLGEDALFFLLVAAVEKLRMQAARLREFEE